MKASIVVQYIYYLTYLNGPGVESPVTDGATGYETGNGLLVELQPGIGA